MLKTKIEKRKVEITKDVICNACGTSCKSDSGLEFSYALLNAHWGYSSPRDGQVHAAHLCNQCFDVIVKNFKIPSLIAEDQF
jgi:hypothetical protein